MVFYQIITLVLLFLLLFIPNQDKGHLYLLILISLTSLFFLPIFLKNLRQDILRKNLITIFFVSFLAISSISTIFSIDQEKSLSRLLLYVDYFIIFTCIKSVFSTFSSKQFLASIFLVYVIALSLISLFNTLIVHNANYQAGGPSFMWIYFGHNHLSAILIFAIPLAFYFLLANWNKILPRLILIFVVGLLLLAMFFTFARGSISSLFIAFFIGSFFLPVSMAKRSLIAYFVGILFIILVLLFNVSSATQNLAERKGKINIINQTNRLLYWNQAVVNFTLHPLWGTGLDSFKKVNRSVLVPQKPNSLKTGFIHNFFLQMLSDTGIFGFLTSIGLIFAVLLKAGKTISSKLYVKSYEQLLFIAFYIGIFASTINTLVDFDWQIPTVFLIFWLIGGLTINSKT